MIILTNFVLLRVAVSFVLYLLFACVLLSFFEISEQTYYEHSYELLLSCQEIYFCAPYAEFLENLFEVIDIISIPLAVKAFFKNFMVTFVAFALATFSVFITLKAFDVVKKLIKRKWESLSNRFDDVKHTPRYQSHDFDRAINLKELDEYLAHVQDNIRGDCILEGALRRVLNLISQVAIIGSELNLVIRNKLAAFFLIKMIEEFVNKDQKQSYYVKVNANEILVSKMPDDGGLKIDL